jgi:hypothetical protein
MCSLPQSEREYLDELRRVVVAIDIRCDRLERLLSRFLAALESRERPPQPPVPMH